MGRTFIQRVLDALYKERTIFSRKKKDTAISETIERVTTGDKAEASNKKAIKANARLKADVKEKPKGETEAESEERIRLSRTGPERGVLFQSESAARISRRSSLGRPQSSDLLPVDFIPGSHRAPSP